MSEGLQRAHAAARFVHAHEAAADPDQAAFELRGNSAEAERFRRHRCNRTHESLHDRLLDRRNPRHRDEKKQNRKAKVFRPGPSSREIKHDEGDRDNGGSVDPIERPPIRICDLEHTHWEEDQKCRHPDRDGDRPFSTFYFLLSTFPLWPSFPAQPKKEEREKRNEPAVTVLLVDRPFAAELPAEHEPKREQHEGA